MESPTSIRLWFWQMSGVTITACLPADLDLLFLGGILVRTAVD
jgi:hypothetical protein